MRTRLKALSRNLAAAAAALALGVSLLTGASPSYAADRTCLKDIVALALAGKLEDAPNALAHRDPRLDALSEVDREAALDFAHELEKMGSSREEALTEAIATIGSYNQTHALDHAEKLAPLYKTRLIEHSTSAQLIALGIDTREKLAAFTSRYHELPTYEKEDFANSVVATVMEKLGDGSKLTIDEIQRNAALAKTMGFASAQELEAARAMIGAEALRIKNALLEDFAELNRLENQENLSRSQKNQLKLLNNKLFYSFDFFSKVKKIKGRRLFPLTMEPGTELFIRRRNYGDYEIEHVFRINPISPDTTEIEFATKQSYRKKSVFLDMMLSLASYNAGEARTSFLFSQYLDRESAQALKEIVKSYSNYFSASGLEQIKNRIQYLDQIAALYKISEVGKEIEAIQTGKKNVTSPKREVARLRKVQEAMLSDFRKKQPHESIMGERLSRGESLLRKDAPQLADELKEILIKNDPDVIVAVEQAHLVGAGGVGKYTQLELLKKTRILKKAGLSKTQREALIRSGVCGDLARMPEEFLVIALADTAVEENIGKIRELTDQTRELQKALRERAARKLTAEQVATYEKELNSKREALTTALEESKKVQRDGEFKKLDAEVDQLLKDARAELASGRTLSKPLTLEQRLKRGVAFLAIKSQSAVKELSAIQRGLTEKKNKGLELAHQVGEGGSGPYSVAELHKKVRILKEHGFNAREREILLRSGVCGDEERMAVASGKLFYQLIRDPDSSMRAYAIEQVLPRADIAHGAETQSILIQLLTDEDPSVRVSARYALAEQSELAPHADILAQRPATAVEIEGIAKRAQIEATPRLLEGHTHTASITQEEHSHLLALKSADTSVQAEAIDWFFRNGVGDSPDSHGSLEKMMSALASEDEGYRGAATIVLGSAPLKISSREWVAKYLDPLVTQLVSGKADARDGAAQVLVMRGLADASEVASSQKLLSIKIGPADNREERLTAIKELSKSKSGGEWVKHALARAAIEDPDSRVRDSAKKVLLSKVQGKESSLAFVQHWAYSSKNSDHYKSLLNDIALKSKLTPEESLELYLDWVSSGKSQDISPDSMKFIQSKINSLAMTRSIDTLIRDLHSQNPETQMASAKLLAQRPQRDSSIELLSHQTAEIRALGALSLAQNGLASMDGEIRQNLVRLFEHDSDRLVRVAAAKALAHVETDEGGAMEGVARALVEHLANVQVFEHNETLAALKKLEKNTKNKALKKYIKQNVEFSVHLARGGMLSDGAIGAIGFGTPITLFAALLHSAGAPPTFTGINSVGLGSFFGAFFAIRLDRFSSSEKFALQRYENLPHESKILFSNRAFGMIKGKSVEKIESQALNDLAELLVHTHPTTRTQAARALGSASKRHLPKITEAIVATLKDPDIDVREEAARTLGKLYEGTGNEDVIKALQAATDNEAAPRALKLITHELPAPAPQPQLPAHQPGAKQRTDAEIGEQLKLFERDLTPRFTTDSIK